MCIFQFCGCAALLGVLCFLKDCFVLVFLLFKCLLCSCVPTCCKAPKKLKGKVILITGSAGALGRALALELAIYRPVLVLVDIDEAENERTARLATEARDGCQAHTFTIDVSKREEVFKLAHLVNENYGRIDIVINNAAIANKADLLRLTESDIRRTIDCNLFAHFWVIQAFLPAMIEANSGSIVAISSATGLVGTAKLSDYSASKFGIIGMMESLQVELLNQKVDRVKLTTVCPYFTKTPLFGFAKTRYSCILPQLNAKYVAKKTVRAIRFHQEILLLPPILSVMLGLKGILPASIVRFMGYMFGAHTALEEQNIGVCHRA